jgi:hypothetical protein
MISLRANTGRVTPESFNLRQLATAWAFCVLALQWLRAWRDTRIPRSCCLGSQFWQTSWQHLLWRFYTSPFRGFLMLLLLRLQGLPLQSPKS